MNSSDISDFLSFRKMVTPIIIQGLFWVGVAISVLGGLVSMFRVGFFAGLLTIIIGPIITRIYCELLILFFRMNETLTEIKNNTTK